MANYRRGSVQYVDTSAIFTDIRRVVTVKFIGDLGSAANITPLKTDGTEDTGKKIWEQTGSEDVQGLPLEVVDHDLCIHDTTGVKVNVSGGAVLYLYLE